MFFRALAAFLALPGMVAGVIPFSISLLDPWHRGGTQSGLVVMASGLIILLRCVRDFYVSGKGTLAPWSPPQSLVIVGLYRFVRNPMYVGVLTILAGWVVFSGSPVLLMYAVAVAAMFHRQVTVNEEPWLRRKFPDDWAAYSAGVRRWRPRLNPWFPDQRAAAAR
jgi:protein-S-isoprenylcysteine O-methyltransferase Ste14